MFRLLLCLLTAWTWQAADCLSLVPTHGFVAGWPDCLLLACGAAGQIDH